MLFNRVILVILILGFTLSSCRKDPVISPLDEPIDSVALYVPDLPDQLFDYESITFPDHFQNDPLLNLLINFNSGNPITNEGATLGRVLFYDKNLSANNTISCASCHHQDKAFSDGQQFSAGFNGGHTKRNSMHLVNLEYQRDFFWDERANTIEDQVLMPIQDTIEMGMDLNVLTNKLSALTYYPKLFFDAFGDSVITADYIRDALGQFVRSIRSYRTKYDKGVPVDFSNFSTLENEGRELFFSGQFRCNNCHISQNFGGTSNEINGLDINYADQGIGVITGNPEDMGLFKTVSLRNVELTAPYMHDGRFTTLIQILNFYDGNIQPHAYLDDRLTSDMNTGGPPIDFNMSDHEKEALIAFLRTLTDWELIIDPWYSNPFPW
ncbi:MAG: cytochrome-c peroxidase [Crocinitomicaceae bacterium]|nr:cytochrome-c peroxidase [Crocinitomicaceae bacterium]